MSLSKQAKILSKSQIAALLHHVSAKRQPERNRAIVFLSVKAGLRAKEIANLKWSNVTGPDGVVGDSIALTDTEAKGRSGRIVPMNKVLKASLQELQCFQRTNRTTCSQSLTVGFIVQTERSDRTSPQAIVNMMSGWFRELGFVGASSHSGRRTFITTAAKKVFEVGGSLRDVQQLAGHKSLSVTQRYIEGDTEAKRKLVDLL